MVVVEPVYYGLTDQRHVGSPEADNQDRLDREHHAMTAIVTDALERVTDELGLSRNSIVTRRYAPPGPPVGGAVSITWDIFQIAQSIDWKSEILKMVVLNSLWAGPAFIYRTLHQRWEARETPVSERNIPPISHLSVVGMCFYHASIVHSDLKPNPPRPPDPEEETPALPVAEPITYTVEVPTGKGMLIYQATNRMDLTSLCYKRHAWSRGKKLETMSWYGLLRSQQSRARKLLSR